MNAAKSFLSNIFRVLPLRREKCEQHNSHEPHQTVWDPSTAKANPAWSPQSESKSREQEHHQAAVCGLRAHTLTWDLILHGTTWSHCGGGIRATIWLLDLSHLEMKIRMRPRKAAVVRSRLRKHWHGGWNHVTVQRWIKAQQSSTLVSI